MKKKKKVTKKAKKKGFTLVELLAVIIILAIVVGITIPAVLTTINNTREKAFQTAASSVADWVDRQYQAYLMGNDDIATVDTYFKKLCIRTCGPTTEGDPYTDYAGKTTDLGGTNDCSCDKRVNLLTSEFLTAAGLKPQNITVATIGTNKNQSIRIRKSDGVVLQAGGTTILSLTNSGYDKTRVYINSETGRSCVTLKSSSNGDYISGKTACGGVCQSSDANKPDYCKAS